MRARWGFALRAVVRAVWDPARAVACAALVLAGLAAPGWDRPSLAQGIDLTASYEWNPVAIGAGGWVTGFVTHPLDATVRYCRTDVGNAYRWDARVSRWAPMLICKDDGMGIPATIVRAPGTTGIDSIAIDPSNKKVVLIAFPITHSPDVEKFAPSVNTSVYRSEDGGRTFARSNLSVPGDPNGNWRSNGERLKVDPSNPKIVYFGTHKSGLYRSTDGGISWSRVSDGGAPAAGDIVNVQISASGGTVRSVDQNVSRILFCVVGNGDVFQSEDGGKTWKNITAGSGLSGHAAQSTLDQNGTLYVTQSDSKTYWKYSGGKWSPPITLQIGDGVQNVAVDPRNASRLFVLGRGGSLFRSLDGGAAWTPIARQFLYGNTLGWLPQAIPGWRSNSGICFDRDGELWVAQGNEGMLRYKPSDDNTEAEAHPIQWTIDSAGIEELCTQDVVLPRGGEGKAYVAVQDATGMVIEDPATFSARWIGLETKNLIAHASGIAACPNDPKFVAVAVGGAHGYTADGGKTWQRFAASYPPELVTGAIAVSRRGSWTVGADHIVILPSNNRPPFYSKDGGKTWKETASFPTNSSGAFLGAQDGFWGYFLKQRLLRADPFVADRYYLKLTNGGFYVSNDGGETWSKTSDSLPVTHHGQLDVNYAVRNDLWLADGYAGSYGGKLGSPHGVFHSKDGGATWERVPALEYAISLALGAGPGVKDGARYSVYVYGKLVGDDRWGIFRSTDGGAKWDRISRYPAGIFDQPTCMAASWDRFGLVYVGFGGQSFAYGQPR